MSTVDLVHDVGLNRLYFSLRNMALCSLEADLKKEMYPDIITIKTQWNENSFSSVASLQFFFSVPRCKYLKSVSFNFVREGSGKYFNDVNEKIEILNYNFHDVTSVSASDMVWFRSKCDFEKIMEIINRDYLIYPFKTNSVLVF